MNTRAMTLYPTLWDVDCEVCLIFNDMPANAETLLHICVPMSHIRTKVLNIAFTDCITKLDGQTCFAGSDEAIFPGFSGAPELRS